MALKDSPQTQITAFSTLRNTAVFPKSPGKNNGEQSRIVGGIQECTNCKRKCPVIPKACSLFKAN